MPRSALLRQFLVYPLLVAAGCVLLFGLVRWMTYDARTSADLLGTVRGATGRERWQAAHEFARRVAADPSQQSHPKLGRQTVSVFAATWPEDPQVACYLAGVLGLMAPDGADVALAAALAAEDASLRIHAALALAAVGADGAVAALAPLLGDQDSGVRKAAAHAIGRLGGQGEAEMLIPLLHDPQVDVRWNAALGLATLGSDAGADVLAEMLDRGRLAEVSSGELAGGDQPMTDQVASEVMINAVRAAARLERPEFRVVLEKLRDTDQSPRVRETARLALGEMEK